MSRLMRQASAHSRSRFGANRQGGSGDPLQAWTPAPRRKRLLHFDCAHTADGSGIVSAGLVLDPYQATGLLRAAGHGEGGGLGAAHFDGVGFVDQEMDDAALRGYP